jgi:hypothetical protein
MADSVKAAPEPGLFFLILVYLLLAGFTFITLLMFFEAIMDAPLLTWLQGKFRGKK